MAVPDTPEVSTEQFRNTQRSIRYLFIAKFKATDTISEMQIEGLTTDLSEGGCGLVTRKGPFSAGTQVLLEITKGDVTLVTHATVIYNLKDQLMGLCFAEMAPEQKAILASWISAASPQLDARQSD
jgi:c-di-GMP-binding flagellar brake protein YcgR